MAAPANTKADPAATDAKPRVNLVPQAARTKHLDSLTDPYDAPTGLQCTSLKFLQNPASSSSIARQARALAAMPPMSPSLKAPRCCEKAKEHRY